MTPEEARRLLDGENPGTWYVDPQRGPDEVRRICTTVSHGEVVMVRTVADDIYDDADTGLIVAAPVLAAMIAGMREEWVGQYLVREGEWATVCAYPTREEVAHHLAHGSWDAYTHTRIARRYITEPEAVDAVD